MANDLVERPIVVAALLALLAVLAVESIAVAATFRNPQTTHPTARSLINYIVERVH